MFVIFIDQNLLLEESWAELFVIMSAQYGLPIESKIYSQFRFINIIIEQIPHSSNHFV